MTMGTILIQHKCVHCLPMFVLTTCSTLDAEDGNFFPCVEISQYMPERTARYVVPCGNPLYEYSCNPNRDC